MEAVNLLEEMVQDFPFESQADKANALGSAFERLVREMMDGPLPFNLVEAPTPGSGKGLMVRAVLGASGTIAPAWAEVTDEAEMRKALTTFFMAGNEVLFIENATRPFTSGVFTGAITDPEWVRPPPHYESSGDRSGSELTVRDR